MQRGDKIDYRPVTNCNNLDFVNFSHLNSFALCLKELVNLPNKKSFSEVFDITLTNDKQYTMKLFLTKKYRRHTTESLNSLHLLYEYTLYLRKIMTITKYKLSPFFLNVMGGNLNVTFDELADFYSNSEQKISRAQMLQSMKFLNLGNKVMVNYKTIDQPIDSVSETTLEYDYGRFTHNFRFGYIVTENIKESLTTYIENNFIKQPIILSKVDEKNLYCILFQLAIACYTMYLYGIAHNDLHSSNIRLKKLDKPKKVFYVVNDKIYSFETEYIVKIYEFDFSYMEGYPNPYLENRLRVWRSTVNKVLEPKDFLKAQCYVVDKVFDRLSDKSILTKYLDCIIPDSAVKEYNQKYPESKVSHDKKYIYDDFFNNDKCLLQGLNDEKDFNMYYGYEKIIDNLAKTYGFVAKEKNIFQYKNYYLNKKDFEKGEFNYKKYIISRDLFITALVEICLKR